MSSTIDVNERAYLSEKNLAQKLDRIKAEFIGLDYDEEREADGSELTYEKPFDAEKIRIDQQMLSVKYMLELMEGNMIELNPGYQRHHVWQDNKRKSLLIESLMLRIPIPAFYFYENENSIYQVIDGQQRLTTIRDFVNGEFKLTGLEYLGNQYNQKKFKDLDAKYVQRIYRTQIAVNVLDARSPRQVIYDIFRRVNTGGVSLNPQEMRNAICKPAVRDFLQRSIKNEHYLSATRHKVNDTRMDSQELALRFYAFYMIYNYQTSKVEYTAPSVSVLLDDTIEKLNQTSADGLKEYIERFNKAMKRCYAAFGEYCFSKLQYENDKATRSRDYINKSLFSAFSVLLLDEQYKTKVLREKQTALQNALARKLQDHKYVSAITTGTGDKKNVETYFRYSREVLEECLTSK